MCCNPLEPSLPAETSSHATDMGIVPVKHIVGHGGLFPQGSNNPPHKSLGLVQLLIYKFLVNLVHMENTHDLQCIS